MTPYCCRGCRAELGETDGPTLRVGPCLFVRPVTVLCRRCGAARTWRPGETPTAKPGPDASGLIRDSTAE